MKSLALLVEGISAIRRTPTGKNSQELSAKDKEITASLKAAGVSFKVPAAVSQAAKKGLSLRAERAKDTERPGGTDIGVARAELLSKGEITYYGVKRMRGYFTRHQSDRSAEGWGDNENPSPGWVAWLLWGGDEGFAWAESLWKEIEKQG